MAVCHEKSASLAAGRQQLEPFESNWRKATSPPLQAKPYLPLLAATKRKVQATETGRRIWISDPASPPSSSFVGRILATCKRPLDIYNKFYYK